MVDLTDWTIDEGIQTHEDQVLYLKAALAEAGDDAAYIGQVLGNIVRVRGIETVAKNIGMDPVSLKNALSGEVVPDFGIVLKVVKALGLEWHVSEAA